MDHNQDNAVNDIADKDKQPSSAWQLIGLSPALADLTIDIDKSLSIGRSDSNDLVLATSQISRQHAKIDRVGEQLYVQDLGSSNGTFVNGERINTRPHALQATDELAFADLLFLVVNDDDISHLDSDSFLETLQETENIIPADATHTPIEQVTQPTPSVATPVIDVMTAQDFVAKQPSAVTTADQPAAINQVTEVNLATDKAKTNTVTPTAYSTIAQTNTPTASSVFTENKSAKPQPINVPVQSAPPSAISTTTTEPIKPAAKKNAALAIIIIVIIVLIILATLFMK